MRWVFNLCNRGELWSHDLQILIFFLFYSCTYNFNWIFWIYDDIYRGLFYLSMSFCALRTANGNVFWLSIHMEVNTERYLSSMHRWYVAFRIYRGCLSPSSWRLATSLKCCRTSITIVRFAAFQLALLILLLAQYTNRFLLCVSWGDNYFFYVLVYLFFYHH